jgi:hypothetical protein
MNALILILLEVQVMIDVMVAPLIYSMQHKIHIELTPPLFRKKKWWFLQDYPSSPTISSLPPHSHRGEDSTLLVGFAKVGCSLYVTLSNIVAGSSSPFGPRR